MKSTRAFLSFCIKNIIIIGGSILIGFLLLVLAYSLPINPIMKNVDASVETVNYISSHMTDPDTGKSLDIYTDSIMMEEAEYESELSAIKKAAFSYYNLIPYFPAQISFVNIHTGTVSCIDMETESYARYWHGYLIFLKPALTFFTYEQIRILNLVLQTSLLAVLLVLIWSKIRESIFPFLITVMLMAPTTISKCLQYSSVYYLMLISTIIYLWNPKKLINHRNIHYYFLVIGIICNYIDFLTAPMITLAFPLCFYVANEIKNGNTCTKDLLWSVLLSCAEWVAGYAFMWVGKWTIAYILKVDAILWTVKNAFLLRSSTEYTARIPTVISNFEYLLSNKYVSWFIVLWIAFFLAYNTVKKRIDWKHLILLFIPMIPAVWTFVMAEHSTVHLWMTFRNMAPAVMSVMLVSVPSKTRNQKELIQQ